MTRFIRPVHHVLIALALLFSQQAAQMHAMGHVESELAAAARGERSDRGDTRSTPPVGHPAEHCMAFHAIDSALPGIATAAPIACGGATLVAGFILPLSFASRIVFDSRAPPLRS